jgi:Helix-turn-helix domain
MAIAELDSRTPSDGLGRGNDHDDDLHELLTVEDVAALLKVSKSWVYEHTRSRSLPRSERLPM